MKTVNFLLLSCILVGSLFSQGVFLFPERPVLSALAQLELKSTDARVLIKNGVATVTLQHIFYNPTSQRIEGEYVFFIPGEGQLKDFYIYIDGEKVKGTVLDAREARGTYEEIVRRIKDPALLEYAGQGIFKTSIFPIEPKDERKIEFCYSSILDYQSNQIKFQLPLRQGGLKVFENLHLSMEIGDDQPLGDIYSPSHPIQLERPNSHTAKISLENSNGQNDKDFVLYYSLAEQEMNCTLISFRPRTDRDGYFLMILSLNDMVNKFRSPAKDIIFVIDVSGSMQGEKISQAKEALKFCVNSLSNDDRFDIISFSSTVDIFQGNLQKATGDAKENASYYIDNLSAAGGTNIQEALKRALQEKKVVDERETSIIFLTDGLPTEGETNIQQILQQASQLIKDRTRIFTFGVGYDVNTFLLDKLALDTQGSSVYVKPNENIEVVVSNFYSKISHPVFTELSLDFGNARVYDIYPVKLPNIFKGERLTILGRYRSPGEVKIKLSGRQQGTRRSFDFTKSFPLRESDNDFIANLWANRKVYHLLTEIRFKGENPELVESVKAIGKEYGIVTPYTSYLVTEQQRELQVLANEVAAGTASISQQRIAQRDMKRKKQAVIDEESIGSPQFFDALVASPAAAEKSSGKGAVMSSRVLKKMEHADKEIEMLLNIQRIGEKTFYLKNGCWVDSDVKPLTAVDRHLIYLSDEYFHLLYKNPDLRRILSLGENIIFEWQGIIYQISAQ